VVDLNDPNLYINRELSALSFNQRVLDQARDPSIPLLERLKFLFIVSRNMDEFFEIRMANLKRQLNYVGKSQIIDGRDIAGLINEVREKARGMIDEEYCILNESLLPDLAKENIVFIDKEHWNEVELAWLSQLFHEEIQPIMTPIGLDLAHPFPRLINKSLNFILELAGKDAFGRDSGLAIVHAPRSVPRVIRLPKQADSTQYRFVLLAEVIHYFAEQLFAGMSVKGCYQFRLTRDSDVNLVEESIEDLPRALQVELLSRRYGEAVRLEIAKHCPDNIVEFLLQKSKLDPKDAYRVDGPVNVHRLMALYHLIDRGDLKYPLLVPRVPEKLMHYRNLFNYLQEKRELLLHHPFESFQPVVDFVHQAALDSNVLAIKQTLYRTGPNSPLVKALVEAARAGKEVTAVVELRARFDEEDNILLANQLQEAGALVVYGVLGYKTHAKMTLIARREDGTLKRYAHLGTGNYHPDNAKLYTDISLFTADPDITEDVHVVFQQLTGMGKAVRLKKLFHAPFNLGKQLIIWIKREADLALKGKSARIIMKMNALTDTLIIKHLYEASQAGVKVDLIVRGICCLRPGIPRISENITVSSIVGRFLEHSRVYYFHNDGDTKVFAASADMMERNLHHRVELCFPIEQPHLAERLAKEALFNYLADNQHRYTPHENGDYERVRNDEPIRDAQIFLLEKLALS